MEITRTFGLCKSATVWVMLTAFLLVPGIQPVAKADSLAYVATGSDQFGTIDLSTGVFTSIGSSGQLLSGLGASGGNLYGGVEGTDDLYQVNTGTGALTSVGTGNINYLATGSTTGGLYAIGGPGTAGSELSLFSIDSSTGAATLIGATGLDISTSVVDTFGLSTGSDTLYLTFGPSFSTDTLYSLSLNTGVAALIGSTTGADAFGADVFENGTLYGGSNTNGSSLVDSLDSLNPTTGAATFIVDESGGAAQFDGLAPASSSPEPGSLLLSLIGVVIIVSRRFSQAPSPR
jgi:hypothetical protein